MGKKTIKRKYIKTRTRRPVVAKEADGSIQITFTIAWKKIEKNQKEAAQELGKEIDVPGFRKGKAPLAKLMEKIPTNTLLEKTMIKILPKLLGETIKEHNLKLAMYPKFELVKAESGKDWQVRTRTAEIPKFDLGDYKNKVKGAIRAKSIWTPKKEKPTTKDTSEKPLGREEKEQIALTTLIESAKITLPSILTDEEVNSRLSRLLERLEKLGLTLESYLSSINKTSQDLRAEYKKQAEEALKLDLILSKIADQENIKVEEKEIEASIKVAGADPKLAKDLNTPQRRSLIEQVLRKRKAINILTSSS